MKIKIQILLFSLVIVFGISCEYLDYSEGSYLTEDELFDEYARARSLLTKVYSRIPDDFMGVAGAMRSSGTDEAVHVNSSNYIRTFNDGSWSPNRTIDARWTVNYSGIREANFFLEESKDETWDELRYNRDPDYEDRMEQFNLFQYEARFLRAFFYFELFKRYGGVPIIGDATLTESEALLVERASAQEVVDYIVSECDVAIANLPENYNDIWGQENFRATKWAAMALKARTLLYAASPLHNPQGDSDKWIAAAEASKAIIDSGVFSLEVDYADAVNKNVSSELLFGKYTGLSNSFERANFPVGFASGNTGTCPTQNLVDAYEMIAWGLPITDGLAGYDPDNPYEGRDERLAKTILTDGATWKGTTLEIWEGGMNAPPLQNATKTGYYLRKYVGESAELEGANVSVLSHTWTLFRYAEVLLNYAEAMNEAYGPQGNGDGVLSDLNALEAVTQVRDRVSLPTFFHSTYNQDQFREALRRERRVELAFEDHRFWDVRRWGIGHDTEIKGMSITKNGDDLSFEVTTVEQRVWEDKMMLFPIPQAEIFINPNLTQNDSW
jgi:hypothetical protein